MKIRDALLTIPLVLAGVLAFVGGAATARADDGREAARAHYARGLELAGQGGYQAALQEFKEAYALSPQFAVLYNIGQAHVALGQPLEAIETLSKYLREGQDQVPLSRREQVQAQIALLESRLAELSITTDRPGAQISVDGREVGPTPLFQPIRLAAGKHTVSAVLEGVPAVVRSVELAESERQMLSLTLPAVAPPPAAPPTLATVPAALPPPIAATPATTTTPAPVAAAPATAPRRHNLPHLAYALAGAGVLLGGAALGTFLWNDGRYNDWRNNAAYLARQPRPIDYYDRAVANNALADSINRISYVTVGLGVAAGALIVGGATLWWLDRKDGATTAGEPRADRAGGGWALGWGWTPGASAEISWTGAW